MKYKAVLLDVDGVLIDSEKIFNLCWRKGAEQVGYVMTYEQALELRSLDSQLAKELSMSWYGDVNAYSAIRNVRKMLMAQLIAEKPLTAKEGVKEFLKEIKSLPVMTAIVTSSPENRIREYLDSVGIDFNLFDAIITTEQVKRGKPFPDVYEHACKAIGYTPNECIAIEDSPNGVKSAHDAGCYTIMIPDMTNVTDELKDYIDEVSVSLKSIVELLRKLG